jgi:hypothetical protein
MTIRSLAAILEQFDQDEEFAIEITNADSEEATITYDIGFDCSESGDFTLRVHA